MPDKVYYERFVLKLPKSKRVPTEDGRGWTSAPNGTRAGEILLEINLDEIVRQLGRKALFNKTRKARGLRGIVKVTAIKIEDQPG